MRRGRRDVADDGGLGVAAQRRLQNARQLAVTVRDVTACIGMHLLSDRHHHVHDTIRGEFGRSTFSASLRLSHVNLHIVSALTMHSDASRARAYTSTYKWLRFALRSDLALVQSRHLEVSHSLASSGRTLDVHALRQFVDDGAQRQQALVDHDALLGAQALGARLAQSLAAGVSDDAGNAVLCHWRVLCQSRDWLIVVMLRSQLAVGFGRCACAAPARQVDEGQR